MNFSFNYSDEFEIGHHLKCDVFSDFVDNFSEDLHNRFNVSYGKSDSIARSAFYSMMSGELWYHTPYHVLSMFDFYAKLSDPPPMSDLERLAIWFHDIVYIPGNSFGSNEIASADVACGVMRHWLSESDEESLRNFIESTADFEKEWVDPRYNLIMDLDLNAFVSSSFVELNEAIRKEFNFLSDASWIAGRRQFLSGMLNRKFVFRTSYFREHFEDKARDNLSTALLEIS